MNEREQPSEQPEPRPSVSALDESASVVVSADPDALYDMVADVTRMGEWSPVCKTCRWESGDGPRVGARFIGHNESSGRSWETTSEVVVAERGREFAFVVTETGTRWGYEFTAVEQGTRVTESWHIPEDAVAGWVEQAGPDAESQIRDRVAQTRAELAATLATIKRAVASG
jgi:hypothetical protein